MSEIHGLGQTLEPPFCSCEGPVRDSTGLFLTHWDILGIHGVGGQWDVDSWMCPLLLSFACPISGETQTPTQAEPPLRTPGSSAL